jgi:glutaredoxin-related protein
VKEFLSTNNIDFDYFDISENLMNLKMYLRCRDFRPEFDDVKEQGKIGIPLIVVGDGEKFIIEREPTLDELK